jgi:hypothetical protein
MPRRKAKSSRPQALALQLSEWTPDELHELMEIAQSLLECYPKPEATPEPMPTRADGSPVGKRGGAGRVEEKMINGCGPYRYLRYWGVTEGGKRTLKSTYLGKANK